MPNSDLGVILLVLLRHFPRPAPLHNSCSNSVAATSHSVILLALSLLPTPHGLPIAAVCNLSHVHCSLVLAFVLGPSALVYGSVRRKLTSTIIVVIP